MAIDKTKYDTFIELGLEDEGGAHALVYVDKKFRLLDTEGNCIIEFDDIETIYREIGAFVKKGEKWGLINPAGKWIVEPVYDNTYPFNNGKAYVDIDGQTGIINEKGEWILKPGEELKPKKDKKGKWGYMDCNNNWVIEPKFDKADSMTHPTKFGWAEIEINGKREYVRQDGNYLVKPLFDEISLFLWLENVLLVKENGKWGYINEDYSWLFEPQFEEADDFHKGLALVKKDGKYGFVKKDGTFLFEPNLDEAYEYQFSKQWGDKGLTLVRKVDLWGVVDSEGNWVFEPQFNDVDLVNFHIYQADGVGKITRNHNGKFYIEWLKEPTYEIKRNPKRSIFLECYLAGVSHHLPKDDDRWDEIDLKDAIVLVRDKENGYDENAVGVALAKELLNPGQINDSRNLQKIIGFIPKTSNKELAEMLDSGKAEFTAKIILLQPWGNPKESIKIRVFRE